jgi:hypothetical protein
MWHCCIKLPTGILYYKTQVVWYVLVKWRGITKCRMRAGRPESDNVKERCCRQHGMQRRWVLNVAGEEVRMKERNLNYAVGRINVGEFCIYPWISSIHSGEGFFKICQFDVIAVWRALRQRFEYEWFFETYKFDFCFSLKKFSRSTNLTSFKAAGSSAFTLKGTEPLFIAPDSRHNLWHFSFVLFSPEYRFGNRPLWQFFHSLLR